MKAKIRILKWMMVVVLGMGVSGAWGQIDPSVTQTVCPGNEPYLVTPGSTSNTFLWSISSGTSGVDWTITTPNTYTTHVIWENLTAAPITYNLTLKEDNGTCFTTVSVAVTVNPRLGPPTISLLQPTCAVSTGTVTVNTPVPVAGISYTIKGTDPIVAAVNNAAGIFAGLAPGVYDVTASNSYGCPSSPTSITILAQPATPTAPTASLTQPTCAVSTGTITVTLPAPATGITYTVTGTNPVVGAVSNATGIFAGLAPGAYDVTTTNSVGCTSLATSVTILAQPASPNTSVIFHN